MLQLTPVKPTQTALDMVFAFLRTVLVSLDLEENVVMLDLTPLVHFLLLMPILQTSILLFQ